MKNNPLIHIAFTLLCLMFITACSSNVKEEIKRAEDLATIAPDSAFAILEGIRTDALEDAKIKPEYDLVWAETYYMKHRTLTDSIDECLLKLETEPGSKQNNMQNVLHAISLLRENNVKEAFAIFEECSRKMNNIGLYWQCLVEDYLGIIYMDTGLSAQAKESFHNVLNISKAMENPKAIANANCHLSCCYHMANELDSALFYATEVLSNEYPLDSQMLAIAYQNLYYIQLSVKDSVRANHLDILQLYDSYKVNTADSLLTFALMSQAYFLSEQLDSAQIFQNKVEKGYHNNAKLVLYKFLSDYYQKYENTDSAFKYLKLYGRMDSICSQAKSIEPLLNTVYVHNQEEAEKQSSKQKILIAITAVVIILIVIMLLRIRHKRKMSTAYDEIEQQSIQIDALDKQANKLTDDLRASREESLKLHEKVNEQEITIENAESDKRHYKEELSNTQKTLVNTQTELKKTTGILSLAHKKIENYQALISKKNSKLAQANREREKSDSNKKNQSRVTVQNFLDKTNIPDCKMKKSQMQYIIDSYEESATEKQDFIHSLMRKSEGLTTTGIIICILYHEGFYDEEIIAKLHYDSNNFRTAKSRARAAIDTPSNVDSSLIKELLRRFDYKKSGG